MAACIRCNDKALVIDSVTGVTVCSSCGIVQGSYNFQEQYQPGASNYIRIGTTGHDNDYSYKERKVYRANGVIDEIAFRLDFAEQTQEVKDMINKVTEGEFGDGNWFDVLVGACCYIIMRNKNRVLTMSEVCDVVGSELYEMGRMVGRVVDFLGIELPEFDVVALLEKTIRGFSGFSNVDSEKIEVMVKQGNFVVQCCIKWWLTTGRRPAQVAVAVLVFVAEVNGVKVRIEEVAKEVKVGLATCRLRYKELLEALVEVAKGLPWGEDVNVKNVVRNAPFVLKYMEMKSMEDKGSVKKTGFGDGLGHCGNVQREDHKKRRVGNGSAGLDFDDVSRVGNGIAVGGSGVEAQSQDGGCDSGIGTLEDFKASQEALASLYSKFKADFANRKITNRDGGYDYGDGLDDLDLRVFDEWWSGKSALCEKLFLDELEEKDVGLNPLPPSYIQGCEAVKRRKGKIRAARIRINSIRLPLPDKTVCSRLRTQTANSSDLSLSANVTDPKKRKNRSKKREPQHDSIDWEDFIIETLLLHKVKEEEIEKGHYKALLGLHVFTGSDDTFESQ